MWQMVGKLEKLRSKDTLMITNPMFNLESKVVVITGGAGLLGAKHAEAILESGGKVALMDINSAALDAVAKQLNAPDRICTVVADISDEAQVNQAFETICKTLGRPNGLINNATIDPKAGKNSRLTRLEDFDIAQWNFEIAVGLTGALICSKVFGADMAKNGGGTIINISSDLGIIAPDQRLYRVPGLPENEQPVKPVTYSVIKHGIIGLTKYIATYWSDQNVRCNALAPGGVFDGQGDAFVTELVQRIPLKRMASVDDYKGAIVFLCSDSSSYMTGATLVVDGGRTTL